MVFVILTIFCKKSVQLVGEAFGIVDWWHVLKESHGYSPTKVRVDPDLRLSGGMDAT